MWQPFWRSSLVLPLLSTPSSFILWLSRWAYGLSGMGRTQACHCSALPLLLFFDSINDLTGSQVCDNLSEGAPWSCQCSVPPLLLLFDSINDLTGSQVCDNLSEGAPWPWHCSAPPTYILWLNQWPYRLSGMCQPSEGAPQSCHYLAPPSYLLDSSISFSEGTSEPC